MLKFLHETVTAESLLDLQKKLCDKTVLPHTEDYQGTLGDHSDKLEFITVMGNVYRSQTKTITEATIGEQGKTKKTVTSYMPCGVKLRALVDLEVPVIPTETADEVSADFSKFRVQEVKAGEYFTLTYAAAVFLLTQPYFNGVIKGAGLQPDTLLRVRYNKKSETHRAYFGYKRCSKEKKTGALKDNIQLIGGKNEEDGMVYMYEEYLEQFSSLGTHSSYQKTRRFRQKEFTVTQKAKAHKPVVIPKQGLGNFMGMLQGQG